MEIQKFTFGGTRQEIGFAVGEELRSKIQTLLSERLEILLSIPGANMLDIDNICAAGWAAFEQACPGIFLEVESTALSACIDPKLMLIAGGYTDVMDCLSGSHSVATGECTVTANSGLAAVYGTWDSHPSAIDALVLVERNLMNGTKTLALTTAGWPAQQGVNSHGLSFAITNLTPEFADPSGLNYICANAVLAESESLEDFLYFAGQAMFASGHSYIIAEASGKSAVIETTASKIDVAYVTGCRSQANHYCGKHAIDSNKRYPFLAGSIDRINEMKKIASGVRDSTDLFSAIKASRFIRKTEKQRLSFTCAVFFASARLKTLYYSKGASKGAQVEQAILF